MSYLGTTVYPIVTLPELVTDSLGYQPSDANTVAQLNTTTGVYANAAYNAANTANFEVAIVNQRALSAGEYANSAFGAANTSNSNAATADQKAVISGVYANSAYLQANTATTDAASVRLHANGAYIQANSASNIANTVDQKAVSAGSYANSAYNQANTSTTNAATADQRAVTSGSYANSAYTVANTFTTFVNSGGTINGKLDVTVTGANLVQQLVGTSGVYSRIGTTTSSFYTVHNGTTDTFLYTQEASALRLGTNATERVRIDSSGNVGIGEITPANYGKFVITGNPANGPQLSINASTGQALLNFYENTSGRFSLRTINGSSGIAFHDTFNGVERVRIDSSGNLGVGTTNPYSRLNVSHNTSSYWNNSNAWVNGVPAAVTITSTTPGGYDATVIGQMTDSGGTSKNAWAIGSVGTGPWTAGNDSTQAASLYFAIRNLSGGITERMRITSTGMVGIGTTGPARRLVVSNGNSEGVEIGPGNTSGDPVGAVSFIYYNRNSSVYVQNIQDASSHFFRINGSNRAVFNTSGDFALGKTTASEATSSGSGFGFAAASVDPFFSVVNTSGVNYCIYLNKRNTSTSSGFINFTSNDGTNTTGVGSITHNGTNTSYNTSSDYRLKNIEGLLTNSGSYIDSLRPVHGTWKSTGRKFIGLIAHEAQAVSQTDVATGEKDGEEMQAMDYSNPEFIANIIAELQSLRKRVAELESTR